MVPITKQIKQINCYASQNHPKYIVIHETDNFNKGAGAASHARAHNNGNLATSVHYYVDDVAIYQTLNHTDGAWAVGKQYGTPLVAGVNNNNTINIEICVNPDSNYDKARLNCVDLVRHLIQEMGIPADRVIRHYDAKRKWCPRKMMDSPELWTDFCLRIRGQVDEVKSFEDGAGNWHFTINGELQKARWVKYKNKWFYVDDAGNMVTGYTVIGGLAYMLNPSKADMATYGALLVTNSLAQGNLEVQHVE